MSELNAWLAIFYANMKEDAKNDLYDILEIVDDIKVTYESLERPFSA